MGCKGKKRREKNYEAAHGGKNTRLPPPPESSSVDALPSKLRRIMPFMGSVKKPSSLLGQSNGSGEAKGIGSGEKPSFTSSGTKRKASDESLITQRMEHNDEVPQSSTVEENKRKKKKKRTQNKQANDLRFEKGDDSAAVVSKRKERKKQRLKERKKGKKTREEDDADFPGREQVNFGDIVEAPPKFTVVPKAFKVNQDASKERLRLQAIESYRNRRGWESRPGVQLPTTL